VRFLLDSRGSGEAGRRILTQVFDLKDPSIIEVASRARLLAWKVYARFVLQDYRAGFYQDRSYPLDLGPSFRPPFARVVAYQRSPWVERLGAGNAVAIHVRGGDYLADGAVQHYGGICTRDYYRCAAEGLAASLDHPIWYVFTNDRRHAEEILGELPSRPVFVEEPAFEDDPGFDLYAMSRCRNFVISNSTFAWWGAWLGAGNEGLVCCPATWSRGESDEIEKLALPGWRRIPS